MGEEDPCVGQLQAVGEPCLPGLGEEAPSCLFFLSASVAGLHKTCVLVGDS